MRHSFVLSSLLLSGLAALAGMTEDTLRRGVQAQGLVFLPDGTAVMGIPPSNNSMPREGWLTWAPNQGWSTGGKFKGLQLGYMEDEAGSGKPTVLLVNGSIGQAALAEWNGEEFAHGPAVPEGIIANRLWLGPSNSVFALCVQDGLLLQREGDRWTDRRLLSNLPGIELQADRNVGMPRSMQRSPRPLRALNPPGRGTWFYQPVLATNLAACSSFLCWEGNVWEHRDPGGETPFRIAAAGCNPQGEVWCAGTAGELARCPPGGKTFARLPDTLAPGELIAELEGLADGVHWLAMVMAPPKSPNLTRRIFSLRLFAADGTSRPIPSFDAPETIEPGRSPGWKSARTEDGDLWLAGLGPGLVRVNRDGSRASRLGWQAGFPFRDVRSLAIREGRIHVTGTIAAVIPVPSWDKAIPLPASKEWTQEDLDGIALPETGANLHLATWMSEWLGEDRMRPQAIATPAAEKAIHRWQGSAWEKVTLPEEARVAEPVTSSDGSLWMVDALRTHVYRGGSWISYPTLETALEAELANTDIPAAFTLGGPRAPVHAITGIRGAILYRRGASIVGYHDGTGWRTRGVNLSTSVTGMASGTRFTAKHTPEFTSEETPALRLDRDPDRGPAVANFWYAWTGKEFEKRESPRPNPAEDIFIPDNRGLLWQSDQGSWTTGDTSTRLRIPGEAAPLPIHRFYLEGIHWEADGTLRLLERHRLSRMRTTISTRRTLRPALTLSWANPPPEHHLYGHPLTLTPRGPEGVEAWLAWRLDAAPARLMPPGHPTVLKLGSLSKGAHRLEVWAMDSGAASGPVLSHRFTVGENQEQAAQRRRKALDGLLSQDPIQRMRAADSLRGESGRADVVRLRDAAPPSERWWFDNLILDMQD